MTTLAPTGRPAWAVWAWVDDNRIYVELPTKDSAHATYIMAFPLHEISKALALMRSAHIKSRPTGGAYKLPEQPIVRKLAPKSAFTDEQRAKATALLKRMKIT